MTVETLETTGKVPELEMAAVSAWGVNPSYITQLHNRSQLERLLFYIRL